MNAAATAITAPHPSGIPKSRLRPERGAEHLGEVGRHRDHLGLEPEPEADAAREVVAADLGEVAAGGDPELRRERLDEHRHEVRGQHRPEQEVAVLGAAGDVGGEVAGVDVGDRGDERGPEERPERAQPGAVAVDRLLRGPERRRLAGQDAADADRGRPRTAACSRLDLHAHRPRESAAAAGAWSSPARTPPRDYLEPSPGRIPRSASSRSSFGSLSETRTKVPGRRGRERTAQRCRARRRCRRGPGSGRRAGRSVGSPSLAAIRSSRPSERTCSSTSASACTWSQRTPSSSTRKSLEQPVVAQDLERDPATLVGQPDAPVADVGDVAERRRAS